MTGDFNIRNEYLAFLSFLKFMRSYLYPLPSLPCLEARKNPQLFKRQPERHGPRCHPQPDRDETFVEGRHTLGLDRLEQAVEGPSVSRSLIKAVSILFSPKRLYSVQKSE